ncbi:hypothetical protein [Primorskyibacter sedentarius]|nr:hypothetical protein [Primorskyibacter sedentarius]
MAHMLIGASLALFYAPTLLVTVLFVGWTAKELLGDIPGGGAAWPTVNLSGDLKDFLNIEELRRCIEKWLGGLSQHMAKVFTC